MSNFTNVGMATAGEGKKTSLFSYRVGAIIASWAPPLITFFVVAVVWQLLAISNPFVIPTLDAIGSSLLESPQMYWANMLVTSQEIAIGAGFGILCGFLLAVIMAELPIVERAVMPLMVVIMVTPVVAIAPALVVAFGFGMMPKYIVTGLVVFFPMLVNSLAGLKDVDARALDVMRTLNASRWEIFRDLRFPGSMPFFFAGLRIALPLSVVGAAVAEFVAPGQQAGLGSLLTIAAAQANLPVTWACIVLLCVLGVVLVSALAVVRKRVLWWSDQSIVGR
ncbi:ABC transporter permease [Pelagibacterium lentulum]|uniref:ABC transporter permease n=1 Tax=Pelagibacterium lentulum TaxID=2029865 RepID=A0A916VW66_9HYPH|nr:ABC transporter permease [Pelagibacterium lentulum]GGA43038.1 ABC transporter permease [Pelagibacterium lentulum]